MNMRHGLTAVVVVLMLTACTKNQATSKELLHKKIAMYQQAIKNQKQDHERITKYYDKTEALHARAEAMVSKQEEMLNRQAADFDRFEKILDTWEKQQAQYQRYLDSLNK